MHHQDGVLLSQGEGHHRLYTWRDSNEILRTDALRCRIQILVGHLSPALLHTGSAFVLLLITPFQCVAAITKVTGLPPVQWFAFAV
ncbi:hypothetical protein R1flu_016286 [Riccia fluitans]|uniref:Uncharacterized protein n=1 Tax=Riccia fluitans TaxID=41844 RepID=A0ABD1YM81_9MARC